VDVLAISLNSKKPQEFLIQYKVKGKATKETYSSNESEMVVKEIQKNLNSKEKKFKGKEYEMETNFDLIISTNGYMIQIKEENSNFFPLKNLKKLYFLEVISLDN
jgi:hypothetical protein